MTETLLLETQQDRDLLSARLTETLSDLRLKTRDIEELKLKLAAASPGPSPSMSSPSQSGTYYVSTSASVGQIQNNPMLANANSSEPFSVSPVKLSNSFLIGSGNTETNSPAPLAVAETDHSLRGELTVQACAEITTAIVAFEKGLELSRVSLEAQVANYLDNFEFRVDVAADNLRVVTDSCRRLEQYHASSRQQMNTMLDAERRETQASEVKVAQHEAAIEELNLEIRRLRASATTSTRQLGTYEPFDEEPSILDARSTYSQSNMLNRSMLDRSHDQTQAESMVSLGTHRVATSVMVSNEEASRLADRIEDVERRAVEASAHGAKVYARSARTIAYLEGKISSLSVYVDHLRLVNSKLVGDVKAARIEGSQAKRSEHRLQLAMQEDAAMRAKLASLETLLTDKEEELLRLDGEVRVREQAQVLKHEAALGEAKEAMRSLQVTFASTIQQLEALKVESAEFAATAAADKKLLEKRAEEAHYQVSVAEFKLNSITTDLEGLRTSIREKEITTLMLEENNKVSESEFKAREEDVRRRHERADSERREALAQLAVAEEKLKVSDERLSMADERAIEKESALISALNQLAETESEIRRLNGLVQNMSADNSAFIRDREEYENRIAQLMGDLDASKEQFAEWEQVVHRRTLEKLEKTEEKLSVVLDESDSTKDRLNQVLQDYESLHQHTTDLDSRKKKVDSELAGALKREQSLEMKVLDLKNEIKAVRSQFEDVHLKITTQTDEQKSLKGELSEASVVIEGQLTRIYELESQLKSAHLSLATVESMSEQLSSDIVSCCQGLDSSSGPIISMGSPIPYPSSRRALRPENTVAMDLLISPPGVSSMPSSTSSNSNNLGTAKLSQLRIPLEELKNKADYFVKQGAVLSETLEFARHDLSESRRQTDVLEQRLAVAQLEADRLRGQLMCTEEELNGTRETAASLTVEKDTLATATDAALNRLLHIQKDLEAVCSAVGTRVRLEGDTVGANTGILTLTQASLTTALMAKPTPAGAVVGPGKASSLSVEAGASLLSTSCALEVQVKALQASSAALNQNFDSLVHESAKRQYALDR